MARNAGLTLRMPQPYMQSVIIINKEVIADFFAKLGAIYGRLNLISKPGQITRLA